MSPPSITRASIPSWRERIMFTKLSRTANFCQNGAQAVPVDCNINFPAILSLCSCAVSDKTGCRLHFNSFVFCFETFSCARKTRTKPVFITKIAYPPISSAKWQIPKSCRDPGIPGLEISQSQIAGLKKTSLRDCNIRRIERSLRVAYIRIETTNGTLK